MLFLVLSIVCNAQTFISLDGDTTVVTEYNDGKQWAYRDAANFVVGLSCNEARTITGNTIK